MLGLVDFAALCHRAETLLEDPNPEGLVEVSEIHRRLTEMADGGRVVAEVEPPRPEDPARELHPGPGDPDLEVHLATEVRVPTEVIDGMSERSARMRVLSVGSASLVNRVFRLAHLAEKGVGEAAPQQVLATLATSLRRLGVEFDAGQRRIQRLSEGLLDALLRQQVRPLRPVLESLARHARELSETLGRSSASRCRGARPNSTAESSVVCWRCSSTSCEMPSTTASNAPRSDCGRERTPSGGSMWRRRPRVTASV